MWLRALDLPRRYLQGCSKYSIPFAKKQGNFHKKYEGVGNCFHKLPKKRSFSGKMKNQKLQTLQTSGDFSSSIWGRSEPYARSTLPERRHLEQTYT